MNQSFVELTDEDLLYVYGGSGAASVACDTFCAYVAGKASPVAGALCTLACGVVDSMSSDSSDQPPPDNSGAGGESGGGQGGGEGSGGGDVGGGDGGDFGGFCGGGS